MCGIVGFQGDFDRELLRAMVTAVAHRGPDGEGLRVLETPGSRPTGLGHRRLAIIDLSDAGLQPMTVRPDPGGGMQQGLTLIYNGEIYNFRELRAELEKQGHQFSTASDSEVLLHLYEQHGLGMLQVLNGIFALAIHDARPAGRPEGVPLGSLLLARDHLGVKPLYYAETDRGLLFGSEIKSLIRYRPLSRELDLEALHYTLAYLWTPAPRTLLTNVRKLEPGTALLVHDGRIQRKWSYYDLPYDGSRVRGSFDDVARELASRVETAVKRQLVADVPVGALLSGGLDSSAVVAMMRRVQPDQQIRCFTIGFPPNVEMDGAPADLPFARKAARHLGVDLEEIVVEADAIKRLDQIVHMLDEPQADPAPINALLISERARAQGIPVLLSGGGGDDLFGGYRRHWALEFERRWTWLPQVLRAGLQCATATVATSALGRGRTSARRLAKMFAYAGESADRRLVSYFLWSTDSLRRALYSPQLSAQLNGADSMAPLLKSLDRIPREADRLQRMLYLEAKHFLADHNLNYTDRAGMAVAIEIRVPLIDVDLAHFATKIPSEMKQRGTVGKAIFKRAMEPYLPADIIYRPKTGFGAPLRRWLRDELRPMVDDTLGASALRKRGLFEPAAVRQLIELDRAGKVDGSYTLFALMSLELWCRQFVD